MQSLVSEVRLWVRGRDRDIMKVMIRVRIRVRVRVRVRVSHKLLHNYTVNSTLQPCEALRSPPYAYETSCWRRFSAARCFIACLMGIGGASAIDGHSLGSGQTIIQVSCIYLGISRWGFDQAGISEMG